MVSIAKEDQEKIKAYFEENLKEPVKLVYFTQKASKLLVPGRECQFCEETRQILEEVASLSSKATLEVHDLVAESEVATSFGVEMIPATVMVGQNKGAIRYFGIPSGYEFSTLIEDIADLSTGNSNLSAKTKEELATLTEDVHIQVFVTPT